MATAARGRQKQYFTASKTFTTFTSLLPEHAAGVEREFLSAQLGTRIRGGSNFDERFRRMWEIFLLSAAGDLPEPAEVIIFQAVLFQGGAATGSIAAPPPEPGPVQPGIAREALDLPARRARPSPS